MPSPIKIKSPLPADDLIFASMAMQEGISVLGEMQLELLSSKADLKPDDLLGQPLTVSVELADDKRRHFNGHVTRFGIGRHRGRHFGYQATVRPWLWILTRTSDCRIFSGPPGPRCTVASPAHFPVRNETFFIASFWASALGGCARQTREESARKMRMTMLEV